MFRPRLPLILTLVVGGLAALAAVRVWSTGRGLWLDELSIAINLRNKTFGELSGPLEYYQVAPYGWLLLGTAIHRAVGGEELALRAPSLLAVLALLGLTAVIARRAIGRWAMPAAVALVGFAPQILYFAGELKQYAVEAAVALGLLVIGDGLTRRVSAGRFPSPRFLVVAMLAAAVGLTLSFSGLIVLAGVAVGLGGYYVGRRQWRALLPLALVTGPAGLVGLALVARRRAQPLAPGQQEHFAVGMPPGPAPGEVAGWLPQMWQAFVATPLDWRSPTVALLLVLGGLVALVLRRRYHWAAMFGAVGLFGILAAVAQGLPLADRVALYLVAPATLLAVAGLDGLARVTWHGAHRVLAARPVRSPTTASVTAGVAAGAVAASAVLVAGPNLAGGVSEALAPLDRDPGREVLADLGGRIRPGDVVVAYWFADQIVRWYGPESGVEVAGRLRLVPADDPECRPETVDDLLTGARRVWYFHGATASADPKDYPSRVVRELAAHGEIVDARSAGPDAFGPDPGWVLIDLTADPDPAPPAAGTDPAHACLTDITAD